MKRGKFIAIEGGEGAGKDTQIILLQDALSLEPITFTREPGGTALGEKVRSVLLSYSSSNIAPETELFLFVAARAQLVREIIKPTIESGRHIISNRFSLSTAAYQIYGRRRQEHAAFLESISQVAISDFQPDLYILLDLPPETGLKRTIGRRTNNRLDAEPLDFHRRVREGYLSEIKKQKNYLIIDASRSSKVVFQDVLVAVKNCLNDN